MAVAAQNKRKTNHEPNKEDRNKLAIGYRLILGVLVSVFALQAQADGAYGRNKESNCEVWKPEPLLTRDVEWRGQCVNGKAKGFGTIQFFNNEKTVNFRCEGVFADGKLNGNGKCKILGDQTYEGEMRDTLANGLGVFKYADSSIYKGNFVNHKREGFGTFVTPKEKFDASKRSSEGTWINDEYIETGLWQKGQLIFPCTSPQNCKQEQAKREAQERRDQAARDEQYRRDAPARQARQMCEAQKQTCLASCPAFRSPRGAEGLILNDAHFSCNRRCESISCN